MFWVVGVVDGDSSKPVVGIARLTCGEMVRCEPSLVREGGAAKP